MSLRELRVGRQRAAVALHRRFQPVGPAVTDSEIIQRGRVGQAELDSLLEVLRRFSVGLLLALEQKFYSEASQDFEKAVQLGLTDPATLNYLGISYSRTDRLELAMKSYRRALAADPKFAQAHLNLALVYHRLGRENDARREYDTACRLDKKLCQYTLPQP